ncbi:MAG: ABC transporter permease [Leptolyngbyaceae cyanobacterium SL_7_1]|nr:ABC transporter permease [Leptolyngbyaceae cyanobacterium SL_7_1]
MIILANILAIYRRELQSYFSSPFAYVIAGVFWFLSGVIFLQTLQGASLSASLGDQAGTGSVDVPYLLLVNFLGWLAIVSLFLLPMLSMGLYSEERKRGTLELLATSPVTNWAVAVGKLLGVVTFYVTLLLPVMVYEAIVLSTAEPAVQPAVMVLGHLGLVLMATSVLSLGMFISSLTDSTLLAAILTFGVMLVLLLVNWVAESVSGGLADTLRHLSMLTHYSNFIQGIVDTSSLILFGSYIFLGVFLTAQTIEALRFQRS